MDCKAFLRELRGEPSKLAALCGSGGRKPTGRLTPIPPQDGRVQGWSTEHAVGGRPSEAPQADHRNPKHCDSDPYQHEP